MAQNKPYLIIDDPYREVTQEQADQTREVVARWYQELVRKNIVEVGRTKIVDYDISLKILQEDQALGVDDGIA